MKYRERGKFKKKRKTEKWGRETRKGRIWVVGKREKVREIERKARGRYSETSKEEEKKNERAKEKGEKEKDKWRGGETAKAQKETGGKNKI